MNFLEVGDLSGLFAIIILVMFGPPLLLIIIGASIRKKNKDISTVLFILAAFYLLVGLGLCFGGLA
ncbi:hypothetical protein [uncultured Tenacibaculum sp.]|uniref:hypothetical protein n=1 Tax=uncultured Tenacibaculum sp. TaxID=174713 RepID=UPI00263288F3|nr:hypothetical protein [uncultured Tenacibaculum sp.]